MCVTTTDLQDGDIAAGQMRVFMLDKMRYEHTFRLTLYQNHRVRKKKIAMCGSKVTSSESCRVIFGAKRSMQVSHRRSRYPTLKCCMPPKIAKRSKRNLKSNMVGVCTYYHLRTEM